MELRFRLRPQTDYHVGAGAGIGSQLDSALLRDRDGVPVQRSNIEGLLRDGLRRLLHTHEKLETLFNPHPQDDEGREAEGYCHKGKEVCPLCGIFGTPALPKKWRFSSARPVAVSKPLKRDAWWKEGHSGVQVVSRNRVSPRTRRAVARHLFRQEEGDSRIVFEFTVSCHGESRELREEASLIVAAARMVRHFGSARRRGRGECLISLSSDGTALKDETELTKTWLSVFRSCWLEGIAIDDVPKDDEHGWTLASSASTAPVRCRVIVRADEPILVARRSAAGNVFNGLDHINATTFWGAVLNEAAAQWQLRHHEDKRDDIFYENSYERNEAYESFVTLLLRGAVRFSPLYPAEYDSSGPTLTLMIPMPLDILTCKAYPGFKWKEEELWHHGAKGYAAEGSTPGSCAVEDCDMALETLGGYLPLNKGRVPERKTGAVYCEELHPRINPVTQRVATGDLFGYEALDSGQFFVGEIWCESGTVWENLLGLTGLPLGEKSFTLRLGKATRRGYGLATIAAQRLPDTVPFLEQRGRLSIDKRVVRLDAPLTLTLLSDAILPDAWGRFRQTLDENLLAELLGLSARVKGIFCQTAPVDGFNNHHGLPRWRDIALKAGSAVGFIIKDDEKLLGLQEELQAEDKLSALQRKLEVIEGRGIGLRRNEGFGQVVFNHPIYESRSLDDWKAIETGRIKLEGTLKNLQLAEESDSQLLKNEDSLRSWETELQGFAFPGKLSEKEQERWSNVARWLHENAALGVAENALDEFGKSRLLVDEKVVKEREKDKERFLKDDQLKTLKDWLHKVKERTTMPELRQKMVERLADRLKSITQ